ncbi:MAG: four helix bundle protein [Leeuwenhoekiella sp.]
MGKVERFEDLEIWSEARRLSKEMITLSKSTPLGQNFRLRDQVLASSGSVMDNIAEGFERNGNKEFRQFLSIAKASAGESRSQLYRVFDYGYISDEELKTLVNEAENLSKQISNFIKYLNKTSFKGSKFQKG